MVNGPHIKYKLTKLKKENKNPKQQHICLYHKQKQCSKKKWTSQAAPFLFSSQIEKLQSKLVYIERPLHCFRIRKLFTIKLCHHLRYIRNIVYPHSKTLTAIKSLHFSCHWLFILFKLTCANRLIDVKLRTFRFNYQHQLTSSSLHEYVSDSQENICWKQALQTCSNVVPVFTKTLRGFQANHCMRIFRLNFFSLSHVLTRPFATQEILGDNAPNKFILCSG